MVLGGGRGVAWEAGNEGSGGWDVEGPRRRKTVMEEWKEGKMKGRDVRRREGAGHLSSGECTVWPGRESGPLAGTAQEHEHVCRTRAHTYACVHGGDCGQPKQVRGKEVCVNQSPQSACQSCNFLGLFVLIIFTVKYLLIFINMIRIRVKIFGVILRDFQKTISLIGVYIRFHFTK